MYDIIDPRHRDDIVLRGMHLWGDYSRCCGISCVSRSSEWRMASIR
jgi:hypothetical protein